MTNGSLEEQYKNGFCHHLCTREIITNSIQSRHESQLYSTFIYMSLLIEPWMSLNQKPAGLAWQHYMSLVTEPKNGTDQVKPNGCTPISLPILTHSHQNVFANVTTDEINQGLYSLKGLSLPIISHSHSNVIIYIGSLLDRHGDSFDSK